MKLLLCFAVLPVLLLAPWAHAKLPANTKTRLEAFVQGKPGGIAVAGVDADGPVYFDKVVAARIRFNRDAAGKVTGLTLFQNGRELPAVREP